MQDPKIYTAKCAGGAVADALIAAMTTIDIHDPHQRAALFEGMADTATNRVETMDDCGIIPLIAFRQFASNQLAHAEIEAGL